MKKSISVAILLCFFSYAQACDVCGCAAGGNYFGILPQFRRHFFGMRYQDRDFTSLHPGVEDLSLASKEHFRTYELWGRYVVSPRIHLFAFVPVNHFTRTEEGETVISNGLGDVSILANYILLNTGDSSRFKWKHALQIGGGIKMPTGRTNILSEGLLLNQNIQPGTGSFDFPLSLVYTLRYQHIGLNTELGYRFNTGNKAHYRFGNRFNTACKLFYWQKAGKLSLLPQAGIAFESAASDSRNDIQQPYTGGSVLMANLGLDIYYQRFSFGAGYQHPLFQNVGSGNIQIGSNINSHLIYLF